jgi:hypothetical protein
LKRDIVGNMLAKLSYQNGSYLAPAHDVMMSDSAFPNLPFNPKYGYIPLKRQAVWELRNVTTQDTHC